MNEYDKAINYRKTFISLYDKIRYNIGDEEMQYIQINGYITFIRKEDFKYTVIVDRVKNEVSEGLFKTFAGLGKYKEDNKFFYYLKVPEELLLDWVKSII